MPERLLLERIKDDILILRTYLQEKQRGEEPDITLDLSELLASDLSPFLSLMYCYFSFR
jgi:hypothetical protein